MANPLNSEINALFKKAKKTQAKPDLLSLPGTQERLQLMQKARKSALLFVTHILAAEPEPWQRKALKTISDHDRLAIRAGHGVGKTGFLSWLVLWFLLTRFPCKIGVIANSEKQLRDTIWPEIGMWAQRLPKEFREQIVIEKERVFLKHAPDESFATARTASKDNPDALQGLHSRNMLLLLEEASGLSDAVFERGVGTLSTESAKIVMAGNPTKLSGFFYRAFHEASARWETMRVNCEDVPRARHHIEDVIATWGKESNAYRVRVLGEFPSSEDEQLIPLDIVERAVERAVQPSEVYRVVWGLDVARMGDDRSALAKRKGNVLLEPVKSWRKKDTMQLTGLVIAEYKETPDEDRPSEILVDVIGVGAGVVDRLSEQGLPVRGINVGERASVDDRFVRMRDELWWRAREWFDSMAVAIPKDKALIEELTAPSYTFTSQGKILVERKADLKARGLPSPDIADSLVLTFAGGFDLVKTDEKPKRYTGRRSGTPDGLTWMAA